MISTYQLTSALLLAAWAQNKMLLVGFNISAGANCRQGEKSKHTVKYSFSYFHEE
jgi:hypothetical protein